MSIDFQTLQASAEARICSLHQDAALARAVKRDWTWSKLIPRRSRLFNLIGDLTPHPQR
jgi:hypothetical protein